MTRDVVVDGLPYPVVIAADGASALARLIAADCADAVVMHDAAVQARAAALGDALRSGGAKVRTLVGLRVDAQTKRMSTVLRCYDALLDAGAERGTWLLAVGGGTLTDLAGFVAATYLRGIAWAAMPTTVLGMADAAIGGKTAIDLERGKNLVGAFWPARAVSGDLASLATLPAAERATGLAEIAKCGVIRDGALLDAIGPLARDDDPDAWCRAIAAAARVKAEIVAADPLERGERAVLNLGHTIGHALEAATGFAVPHGHAVAIGMRGAGLLAASRGWWSVAEQRRLLAALDGAGLPLVARGIDEAAILAALDRDKKRVDGVVRFVLPIHIGDVRHGVEVPRESVRAAVSAILREPAADERGA